MMTGGREVFSRSDDRESMRVRGLTVRTRATRASASRTLVHGISFDIQQGEVFGLLGESGSGKSMTASAITRLLPPLVELGEESEVHIAGRDVTKLSNREFHKSVQPAIGYIFQNPAGSLNPAMTVGAQIAEAVRGSRRAARARAIELMERVEIPNAASRYSDYPHQFSGGMCQRVAIAMSLANTPRLLLADEPTSALDVTVQAQIVNLLKQLAAEENMSVLFITHDLAVVSSLCDRVGVMRSGLLVEVGTTREVFSNPQNPYTASLLEASAALALPGMAK